MFKKISFIFVCVMLASCASDKALDEGGADTYNTDISEIGISTKSSFRVGMLLPLSGADAKYGSGLKNASMIALQDINNPNLLLQYYDTQSSSAGARIAVENAINQRSDLIIGPLKSAEVQAISNETIYQGIPVIAFSTAQEVLQPTVYSLGLLIEEQVDRILTFAANKGRKRFALLLPDNSTGGAVARAAVKSAKKNGVDVTVIGFYQSGTSNFADIAKQMTNYDKRHERVVKLKAKLKPLVDNGDVEATKAMKKLETREGLGDVGFDALLIPESGAKLTSAISMFAYYDVVYPSVQFLGTSVWDMSRLNNEPMINKSLYPSLSKPKNNDFANQYYAIFNERPSSLYTLAYDAVSIANQLSYLKENNLNENITGEYGFDGVNGKIRFFKNGTNQHSLNVVEILPSGNVVVDDGGKYFETTTEPMPLFEVDDTYKMPKIFGKDETLAQILVYGQPIAFENLQDDEVSVDDFDEEVAQKQLKEMGIHIN